MVGAIPRQPRRFWGVPGWQVSSASCANDRPLWDGEIDPEWSGILLQRVQSGTSTSGPQQRADPPLLACTDLSAVPSSPAGDSSLCPGQEESADPAEPHTGGLTWTS